MLVHDGLHKKETDERSVKMMGKWEYSFNQ